MEICFGRNAESPSHRFFGKAVRKCSDRALKTTWRIHAIFGKKNKLKDDLQPKLNIEWFAGTQSGIIKRVRGAADGVTGATIRVDGGYAIR